MGARKLDSAYVENLWTMFKTIDEKHVVSGEDYKKFASSGINIPKEDAQLTLRIYAKAAKSCSSAEDFGKVLESNEFPAMKLTQKEMEFVKGGALKKAAAGSARVSSDSGASSGSCHGESTTSGRSSGSCHGESA